MKERDIQAEIMMRLGRGDTRLFRNNTGVGWQGPPDRPRPLRCGLCLGSSDLIGWRSVTVTPDMVGRRVAIFTAVEVKSKTGAATQAQQRFIDAVRDAGGIAGVVRSVEEAEKL